MISSVIIEDNIELDIEGRVMHREDTSGHPIIRYKNLQLRLQFISEVNKMYPKDTKTKQLLRYRGRREIELTMERHPGAELKVISGTGNKWKYIWYWTHETRVYASNDYDELGIPMELSYARHNTVCRRMKGGQYKLLNQTVHDFAKIVAGEVK
jgi:hypothetical protein